MCDRVKRGAVLLAVSLLCVVCLAVTAHAQGETAVPAGQSAPDDPALRAMRSVTEGQPGGVEVGQYAADFELEPIEIHADFTRWLGDDAPKSFEEKVMLSDLAGKAPIVLLFGSYT